MRYLMVGLGMALVAAGCAGSGDNAPTVAPVSVVSTQPGQASTTSRAPTTIAATSTQEPDPVPVVELGSLDDLDLSFVAAASGFSQPVLMLPSPVGAALYVVDQPGVIWTMDGSDSAVFLDITDDVLFDNEQGLLGMAFHPDYEANGLFYVYYIASNGDTVVEAMSAIAGVADPGSRQEILRLAQPAANHNGGMIAFGPDGNLWIGLGDGGGANDQFGNGQRTDTMLASMLRVTVGPDIDGYSIPGGNVDGEVWAVGLRNPWRWTFDGNDLWIADVGQARIEEIDVVDWNAGNPNFGWSIMEGSECFEAERCDNTGLVAPIYEYQHAEGCSITGGVVYRGSAIPELQGQFLFADYCNGWLRSVGHDGVVREWLPPGTFTGVTSFGVDAAGEAYLMSTDGSIYAIVAVG